MALQVHNLSDSTREAFFSRLGKDHDYKIANEFGVQTAAVFYYRAKFDIPRFTGGVSPTLRWDSETINDLCEKIKTWDNRNSIAEYFGIKVCSLRSKIASLRRQGYDIPHFSDDIPHSNPNGYAIEKAIRFFDGRLDEDTMNEFKNYMNTKQQ